MECGPASLRKRRCFLTAVSFLLFKPERPKCRWLISPAFLCPVTPSSFLFLHPLLLHRFCFIILCVSVCLKLIRGAALWSLLCRLIYCFIPYLQNDCVCWLSVRTSADLYLQYMEQVTVLWVSLVYNDHPPLILPCMLTWTSGTMNTTPVWLICLYVQFKVKALLLFQHCGIRTYSWWSCCSLMFKLLWHRLSHSPHKALYPSCFPRVVQSVHDPGDHLLSSDLWILLPHLLNVSRYYKTISSRKEYLFYTSNTNLTIMNSFST